MDIFSCIYYSEYKPETFTFAVIIGIIFISACSWIIISNVLKIQPFEKVTARKIRNTVLIGMGAMLFLYLLTLGFLYIYT